LSIAPEIPGLKVKMVNAKEAEGSVDSSQPLQEISAGDRFAFGENWARFFGVLDENRVRQAEQSLCEPLQSSSLVGRRFLDVGSGSGLLSLAARRLGARVHSFDYDPQSVACTLELRRRYFDNDPKWTVDHASVLDPVYPRVSVSSTSFTRGVYCITPGRCGVLWRISSR
jgi:SAM-dependent methyltransferase